VTTTPDADGVDLTRGVGDRAEMTERAPNLR
jgi:hypothetical protein